MEARGSEDFERYCRMSDNVHELRETMSASWFSDIDELQRQVERIRGLERRDFSEGDVKDAYEMFSELLVSIKQKIDNASEVIHRGV